MSLVQTVIASLITRSFPIPCSVPPAASLGSDVRMEILMLWLEWANTVAPISPAAFTAAAESRNFSSPAFKKALAKVGTTSATPCASATHSGSVNKTVANPTCKFECCTVVLQVTFECFARLSLIHLRHCIHRLRECWSVNESCGSEAHDRPGDEQRRSE